jgi:hypothetical protein
MWGVSADKILAWIRSGELPAIDASTKRNGRPRYLVDITELAAFENRRRIDAPKLSRQTKRRPASDVIQFF